MFRRLPPIIQFIFVSMIGIFLGTVAGLIDELLQKPFSAANALVWLFLMIVSAAIVAVIAVYGRNGFR
ncbi:hypothetical protein [Spirosoma agri]|uniref:Uncharacterized protein n=1 Tax=Spirosoma agri TaxID=1987381 RepID=A0A6M0IIQ1_9BACT|nr:hypothetical protein [Spirosoma agri]NEU66863.1 hypothetical protein [Spirosoma agri]